MSYKSIAHFCFMCNYDIAYHGPDMQSANIAPKCNFTVYPASIFFRIHNHHKYFLCIIVQIRTPFTNISTFQHLPSQSENNLESQEVFPKVFWWGQELSRNSQTETTNIILLNVLSSPDFRWTYLLVLTHLQRVLQKLKTEKKLGG